MVDSRKHGINLSSITHTQGCDQPKNAVRRSKIPPSVPQSFGDHIHRTAYSFCTLRFPVTDCQSSLCIFGSHSKKTADPHPENRTGTAQTDGTCHTDNVAGSNSCTQGCTECTVGRSSLTVLRIPECCCKGLYRSRKQSDLGKTGFASKPDSNAQNHNNQRYPAHATVNGQKYVCHSFLLA